MLPRLSQAIAITALLYLIMGMSNSEAISGFSNTTTQTTLAQQHSNSKQLAEIINFKQLK